MPISELEWKALKKRHGNKCVICPATEKYLGGLDKAHFKAESKRGTQYVPLCPNCHQRFDKGLLTKTEQKKLGFENEQGYRRAMPKRKKKTSDGNPWGTIGFP